MRCGVPTPSTSFWKGLAVFFLDLLDGLLHATRKGAQILGCLLHGTRLLRDVVRETGDIAHGVGDVFAAGGDAGHILRNVALRRILLLDSGGDHPGEFIDLADDGGELLNGL